MTKNTAAASGLIDIGPTTLYHEVCGNGPARLLIIGGGGDASLWGPMVPALAADFTVVSSDTCVAGFSAWGVPHSDTYGAHPRVGDMSRALFGAGLLDAHGAEVILVTKTHGPKVPGLTAEMLHTFAAGCHDQSDAPPGAPPELVGTPGPNDCAEIQLGVRERASQHRGRGRPRPPACPALARSTSPATSARHPVQ